MSKFISKLQHNTYEKGEFSDEQLRNLDETIQLIKSFPWDYERPLTDIQLTGPSVTIHDNDLNYLKMGLYFNKKFCVYYLDRDNHLYEYHAADIDHAIALVNDFFNSSIDLSIFEKHFFNIGNQPHFVSKPFIYQIKLWKLVLILIPIILYTVFVLAFIVNNLTGGGIGKNYSALIFILFGGFITLLEIGIFNKRHQYLQISRGNNIFSFGEDKNHIEIYDKMDIKEILAYQNGRSFTTVDQVTIFMKNGNTLIFSNALIGGYTLLSKFPEKLGIPVIYKRNTLFQKN